LLYPCLLALVHNELLQLLLVLGGELGEVDVLVEGRGGVHFCFLVFFKLLGRDLDLRFGYCGGGAEWYVRLVLIELELPRYFLVAI